MAHTTKKALRERQKNNLRRVHFDMPLGTKNMGKTRSQIRDLMVRREIATY